MAVRLFVMAGLDPAISARPVRSRLAGIPEPLLPPGSDTMPFVAFMESLALDGLDLTRERDLGREDPFITVP